ncbi:MAG TPA: type II toxin-antitoxin system VapC family toxin [Thermomicrobiales bacterium]|nr:type II toxin-antitoxin system VapC family toxin [Thermomicrobiales bacterium]
MVRILLDTCVLSEIQRPQGEPRVRRRVAEIAPEELFLSAITLGEASKGIALLVEGRRKRELASWLSGLEQRFGEQILPVTREVAHIWGELAARAQTAGIQIPVTDGLIAATALNHGLHVMTRNTRHFAATGVLIIDPWTP